MTAVPKQDRAELLSAARQDWESVSALLKNQQVIILKGISAFFKEMADEVLGNPTAQMPGGRLQRKLEFSDPIILAGQPFEAWLNRLEVRDVNNHSIATTELVFIPTTGERRAMFWTSAEVKYGAMRPTVSFWELVDQPRY